MQQVALVLCVHSSIPNITKIFLLLDYMKKGKIKLFICHLSPYIISFLVENIFDGDQGDEEYFI